MGGRESWELFVRKAIKGNKTIGCISPLEETCRCVLRRCGGLPLAVVAIGAVWGAKDTANKDEVAVLCHSIGPEIEESSELDSLKKVVSLSFNDLPYYLKSCFLYLG